jgi:NADPH-dependent curcumin reductase CurA
LLIIHSTIFAQNLFNIITRCITVTGFLANEQSLVDRWEKEFYDTIPKMLATGELKFVEDRTEGLEHVATGLAEVMTGKNLGKKIIVVSAEEVRAK